MSWNDNLYCYAQKRGGEYLGGKPNGMSLMDSIWVGWDGILLLEYKNAPLVVQCCSYGGGRNAEGHRAQVLLRCELEREYTLKISPKTSMRRGVNTVLGQLDKGIGRLNQEIELYRDYGCPDVLEGRTVRTSEPQFTQMVFRDLELRNALLANPRYGVLVEKSTPNCMPGSAHQIAAWCELGSTLSLPDEWDLGAGEFSCDSAQVQRERLESSAFHQKLDALIELAKAAYGAVMAWRMPEKKIDK